jgi:hypothetical protein
MAHVFQNTAHTFAATKETATGIAADYHDHQNLWINDPDCFNVQKPVPIDAIAGKPQRPLSLDEARASIVLAAISGGKYEIGDDLPTLGTEPDRLALVLNPDLLQMARVGKAFTPIDLMSYDPGKEQPGVFLLREDPRQSMLAVFNWTQKPRTHLLTLSALELPTSGRKYQLQDVLDKDLPIIFDGKMILLKDQPGHSVRLFKIVDESVPPSPPQITVDVPRIAKIKEEVRFVANVDGDVPVFAYHWDFGDGVISNSYSPNHVYTLPGSYAVKLTAEGLDGLSAEYNFSVAVEGSLAPDPQRRFLEH